MELKEGSWAGQPCYVVGGGPSLRGFDWNLLRDKPNIIVINLAFRKVPWSPIQFTEDARFMRRFGKELSGFSGLKIWHIGIGTHVDDIQEAIKNDSELLTLYETKEGKYWSTSFLDGLSSSSNAAVGAINVADLLGADPIYLMGIDCKAEGHDMGNFHSGEPNSYPREWAVGQMQAQNFKSDFEHWVEPKMRHRKIINLVNPAFESTIDCWPKEHLNVHFEKVKCGTQS